MKKIIIMLAFALIAACANESAQENILNKVLIKNTQQAISSAQELHITLNEKNPNITQIKSHFNELLFYWKKVETLYLAGEFDSNHLDTPRYIDIFHNLKEDLNEQMQRARESKDAANIVLFKNSFKTINALEYILYSNEIISTRDIELAGLITKTIQTHLESILEVYTQNGSKFLSDEVFSNGIIMNTLVQSTYKLKEWRIADVAGLTLKYKNNPNNQRAEYVLSKNSTQAMKAILLTHKEVLNAAHYFDFGDRYEAQLKNDDISKTRTLIDSALEKLALIKNDDLTSKEAKEFYQTVNDLYNQYFFSLIQDLKITSKILDADGD